MPCVQAPLKSPPANAKGGPFDTEQQCKDSIGQEGGCPCCGDGECGSVNGCPADRTLCEKVYPGGVWRGCCPEGCDKLDTDPMYELSCSPVSPVVRYCCDGVCQEEECSCTPGEYCAPDGYVDCGGGAWCPQGMVCFVGANGDPMCDPGAGPGVPASAYVCCDTPQGPSCIQSFNIDDPYSDCS